MCSQKSNILYEKVVNAQPSSNPMCCLNTCTVHLVQVLSLRGPFPLLLPTPSVSTIVPMEGTNILHQRITISPPISPCCSLPDGKGRQKWGIDSALANHIAAEPPISRAGCLMTTHTHPYGHTRFHTAHAHVLKVGTQTDACT
jgi:hypothetical protein